jgi:hypothetical protein
MSVIVCTFFVDPTAEFNNHIDASAEFQPTSKFMSQGEDGNSEAKLPNEKEAMHTENVAVA